MTNTHARTLAHTGARQAGDKVSGVCTSSVQDNKQLVTRKFGMVVLVGAARMIAGNVLRSSLRMLLVGWNGQRRFLIDAASCEMRRSAQRMGRLGGRRTLQVKGGGGRQEAGV